MTDLLTKNTETESGTIAYYSYRNSNQSLVNLYIPGLGDDRTWFPKHFAEYALDRFSWIVPDLLGHGDSSKSNDIEAYTMEQQAKYLAGILERERVEEVSILAHSMGGAIAVSLIERLTSQTGTGAKPRLLFYLEGNLDAGDAFFSSQFAQMPFVEFEREFESIYRRIQADLEDESMTDYAHAFRRAGPFTIWASSRDLAPISVKGDLLKRLQAHLDFPCYFVYGEKNKGRLSSEDLVRDENLPLIYIPDAGHGLHTENPSYFWSVVGTLIENAL
ncbi:alpha/beta hydrolase [Candidatus Thorarchaeota archaeon]|nr:MAG: alpha/beta hydrolase [Candidatus Thorarchaeota archaeon]